MKTSLLVAALASALIAGGFFAFSTFIMKALAQLPAPQGIRAMQSINVVVVPSAFVILLVVTAIGSLVLAVLAFVRWRQPGSGHWLAASALFFFGTFLVTMLFNVPLNDALAAVDPASSEGAALWNRYLTRWTIWNHVRGLAAFGATVLFILARSRVE